MKASSSALVRFCMSEDFSLEGFFKRSLLNSIWSTSKHFKFWKTLSLLPPKVFRVLRKDFPPDVLREILVDPERFLLFPFKEENLAPQNFLETTTDLYFPSLEKIANRLKKLYKMLSKSPDFTYFLKGPTVHIFEDSWLKARKDSFPIFFLEDAP